MSAIGRILEFATRPGVEPEQRTMLHWFRLFMLAHVATRSFLTLRFGQAEGDVHAFILYAQIVVSLVGFVPWNTLYMTRLAALLMAGQIVAVFPLTANHVYLEFIVLGFLALLDEGNDRERALLLQALRWLTASFFFYTGLQKVLYGTYFDGQFLGHAIANVDHFAQLFRHVLPPEEFERLRALGANTPGVGPYRVDSTGFVVMSNGVYVFEMLAPILLMIPRTRTAAAVASIGFVAAIEVGAREIVFGALMTSLLLLYVTPQAMRWAFPIFVAGYLYLVLAAFDIMPIFFYAL